MTRLAAAVLALVAFPIALLGSVHGQAQTPEQAKMLNDVLSNHGFHTARRRRREQAICRKQQSNHAVSET